MALITKSIKGTQDMLPTDSYKWQFVEKTCLETARLHGYGEIRTPVFEHTELFTRGVGDTTDVVQKEMYTFTDRGDRSLSLRPEMTASAVRCAIEHGLINDALPVKACYIAPCYRAEKPQAGRMREFHQFGVELFGAPSPAADAEIISLADATLTELGISGYSLEINSIGCPTCRAEDHKALREYFEGRKDQLCETCLDRLERNPMRIIDCKVPGCQEVAKDAPRMIDYLCDDCRQHFESVKKYLDAMNISYTVNPSIVRGLDYYTRTVFEFVSSDLGAQSTICGGGRYDGLFRQLGGPDTPSLGFGMGLERVMLVMDAQKAAYPEPEKTLIYLAPAGEEAVVRCMALCSQLRAEGFSAETDLNGRSIKAQMKYANKLGAQYTVVIGDRELDSGIVRIKNMATGEETEVTIEPGIVEALYDIGINDTMARLNETVATFEGLADLNRLLSGEEDGGEEGAIDDQSAGETDAPVEIAEERGGEILEEVDELSESGEEA